MNIIATVLRADIDMDDRKKQSADLDFTLTSCGALIWPLSALHPSIQSAIAGTSSDPFTPPAFLSSAAPPLHPHPIILSISRPGTVIPSGSPPSTFDAAAGQEEGGKARAGQHEPVRVPRISCGVGADFCQSLHDGAPMSTLSPSLSFSFLAIM